MAAPVPAPQDETSGLTATERAVLGNISVAEARSRLSAYTRDRLGSPIAEVRFRAGRIDAVWGVGLTDGREVVVKSHRLPVDRSAVIAARDAQRLLRGVGFPCPDPLSGPDEVDGQVLTASRSGTVVVPVPGRALARPARPDRRLPLHARRLRLARRVRAAGRRPDPHPPRHR